MKQKQSIVLSPVQQRAFERLLAGSGVSGVLLLKARPQSGRTTILRKLHEALGGAFVGMPDSEAIFFQKIEQALARHRLVIVDELQLVARAAGDPLLLDAALTAVVGEAAALHRRLIFGTDERAPWPLERRAAVTRV